jgi:hypothetical protein
MAYGSEHMLLAFGGGVASGAEEWSCTLRSTPAVASPDSQSATEAALAELVPILEAWFPPVGGRLTSLAWAKFNHISQDGKYRWPFSVTYEWPTPVPGNASSAPIFPPQVSTVVTLHTDKGRGLASKGRMFLPGSQGTLGADGRLTAVFRDALQTSMATFIGNLNAAAGYGVTKIYSQGGVANTPAEEVVTGVSVGRVLDTMRSRRRSMQEERGEPAAVTAGF